VSPRKAAFAPRRDKRHRRSAPEHHPTGTMQARRPLRDDRAMDGVDDRRRVAWTP
jgi:hypothetical protein